MYYTKPTKKKGDEFFRFGLLATSFGAKRVKDSAVLKIIISSGFSQMAPKLYMQPSTGLH